MYERVKEIVSTDEKSTQRRAECGPSRADHPDIKFIPDFQTSVSCVSCVIKENLLAELIALLPVLGAKTPLCHTRHN